MDSSKLPTFLRDDYSSIRLFINHSRSDSIVRTDYDYDRFLGVSHDSRILWDSFLVLFWFLGIMLIDHKSFETKLSGYFQGLLRFCLR